MFCVKNGPTWERLLRAIAGMGVLAFAYMNWGISGLGVGAGVGAIAKLAERRGEQEGATKSGLHRACELVREYMLGPQTPGKQAHCIIYLSSMEPV